MYMESWMIERLMVCTFAWCMMIVEGILGMMIVVGV